MSAVGTINIFIVCSATFLLVLEFHLPNILRLTSPNSFPTYVPQA